tara:strand:+ start:847 stop:1260 length:414 start_codon:yes stop_codon:yes gene_type:complete
MTKDDDLEEGTTLSIDFGKIFQISEGSHLVVPVVVQDAETKEVLIVAYANEEALLETFKRGEAVFFSTSRNELWHKGATSGDILSVKEVRVNCEQNSLLYLVTPEGEGACHTRSEDDVFRSSCYYRSITSEGKLRFS